MFKNTNQLQQKTQSAQPGQSNNSDVEFSFNDDDSQNLAAELEKFRAHAQRLVDSINQNANQIYYQNYSVSNSLASYNKYSSFVDKYIEDVKIVCARKNNNYEGTCLVQMKIKQISKSQVLFGEPLPNNCVAVTFIPKWTPNRFYCWIPQGVTGIASRLGKLVDSLGPGFHFLPPFTRIEFLVTNSYIPFDYPVKSCPTADCVFVKIDVLIVFCIVDAMKFIINLGPNKLNDIMAAFLEESIRTLARTVYYDEVHDLRGESMEPMRLQLQEKLLEPFGVDVADITITNIHIPNELQSSMEASTSYISKIRCKEKSHEYDIMCLMNREKRHLAQLDHDNERKALDEEAKRFRLLLSKESDEISALTKKLLAEILSEQESQVLKIRLEAEKEEASLQGETSKTVVQIQCNAKKRAAIIEEISLANVKVKESQTRCEVANYIAESINLVSNAEGLSYKDLQPLRQLLFQKKQLEILEEISNNKKIVITGSSDYTQLAQISSLLSPPSAIQLKALSNL